MFFVEACNKMWLLLSGLKCVGNGWSYHTCVDVAETNGSKFSVGRESCITKPSIVILLSL